MQLSAIDLWFSTMTQHLPSVVLSYSRGEELTITGIEAIKGRSTVDQTDSYGNQTSVVSVDFVVKASALQTLGNPLRGDVLEHGGIMYELIEPVSSPADPYGQIIRLHAKRISD